MHKPICNPGTATMFLRLLREAARYVGNFKACVEHESGTWCHFWNTCGLSPRLLSAPVGVRSSPKREIWTAAAPVAAMMMPYCASTVEHLTERRDKTYILVVSVSLVSSKVSLKQGSAVGYCYIKPQWDAARDRAGHNAKLSSALLAPATICRYCHCYQQYHDAKTHFPQISPHGTVQNLLLCVILQVDPMA